VERCLALRLGRRKKLNKANTLIDARVDKLKKCKASMRAWVKHPFRAIKCQFGHVKVCYRGLKKKTAQLKLLFALSNLWIARYQLIRRPRKA